MTAKPTSTQPDSRKIVIWHGPKDIDRLTTLVAEAAAAELFVLNGSSLVHLTEGKLVTVSKDILLGIVARHIATIRLVNRGDTWEVERHAFSFAVGADTTREPDERLLINMMGALTRIVAKAPGTPRALSEDLRQEIMARIRTGELAEKIAAYYNTELDAVKALGGLSY